MIVWACIDRMYCYCLVGVFCGLGWGAIIGVWGNHVLHFTVVERGGKGFGGGLW